MSYLIGIDVGTSATKTTLICDDGQILATSSQSYPLEHPHNGWAEQNPLHWRDAVLKTLADVVKKANVNSVEVAGIGLSGQMHGLVMLDQEGAPIGSSIIWSDQRTEKQVLEMEKLLPRNEWLRITGNPPIAAWTAAKILWVRENEPERLEKCKHILLPKDYIRYVLTGQFASDVSDASGMQLMDIENRCWSREILDLLHIDIDLLPKLYESVKPTGTLLPDIAKECGLSTKTIVAAGASDNAAAAIGTGIVNDGQAFITIGTSSIIYTHLENYTAIPDGQLHVCCSAVPNCWHTMGGPQAAGLSYNWFFDNFCLQYSIEAEEKGQSKYDLADIDIQKVPIGSDRLIYLPFLMGERTPNMDPNCRGVFFGLNTVHGQAHMLRAIMEGIAYSLADCDDILKKVGVNVVALRACGGGSRNKIWLQIIADLLETDITTLMQDEGPAYGVCILAGVAAGIYPNLQSACQKLIQEKHTVKAKEENSRKYQAYHAFYDQLYQHVKSDFTDLQFLP